jgi:hypothetical protein
MYGRGELHIIFVGKPEEKRLLGRPRRRWEDNIKVGVQEVEWGHGLAQNKDRWQSIVNELMDLLVP